ncbi:oligomeric complex COG6 [Atractiella rhizophila]|nr:oligomeric complex COG6 [Atractiella rhizophila]
MATPIASSSSNGASYRNPLSVKVSQILASNYSDPKLRLALETVSDLGLLYASENRHGGGPSNLTREVENRKIENGKKFLKSFKRVNEKLDELEDQIKDMRTQCDEMEDQLSSATESAKYLLQHADSLRNERATTEHQLLLTNLFLSRFTFTPKEVRILNSRDIKVGKELFKALDKCERIRKDCSTLLAGEGDSTRAGYEILAYTSTHMEAGYTKIHKWLTLECRTTFTNTKEIGALDVGNVMREAIRRLRPREEQFKEFLNLLGGARSTSLLSLFQQSLSSTSSSSVSGVRPIELHAHDPLRYIGDMLAWFHQSMAGEREFLEALFALRENQGGRWVGQERKVVEEDEKMVRDLVDKAMEGCTRPLKIRVLQTIKSQEGSIMTYRIATLLHFYQITMRKTMGEDSNISKVLTEITDTAYKVFFDSLESEGRSLLRFIQPPAADLSPPQLLREHVSTLREIMKVFSSSLVNDEEDSESNQEFDRVLKEGLEPAISMCEKMAVLKDAEGKKGMNELSTGKVFLINCLGFIQSILQPFQFAAAKIRSLEADVEGHVNVLTTEHYRLLLKECGLALIISALEEKKEDIPLSLTEEASPKALQQAVKTFDNFLSTVDTLSSSRLGLLFSRKIASSIHHSALERVVQAYARTHAAVMQPQNKYEFRSTVMVRSPEEVMMLLGANSESSSNASG